MTAAEFEKEKSTIVFVCKHKLSAFVQVEVEPIGKWFHNHEKVRRHSHTSENEEVQSDTSEDSDDSQHDFIIEDDVEYLKTLDLDDWKNQDHYRVLGIQNFKYRANEDDIKKAYRVMVLRHHPDKRKTGGEKIENIDDYYPCIKKAYEILGCIETRRAFDSVDPDFNEDVPNTGKNSQANFYEVFAPIFECNARWSTMKHVPMLGSDTDSKEKVTAFYNFWYDFQSWREFSYLDENEVTSGQDRDERRWNEKQNKVERIRRKKEEVGRIRRLVDNAFSIDPRMARFKEEEKEQRLAAKKAKQDAIKEKQEEQQRIRREAEEAAQKKKDEEAAELKAKQDIEKRERDIIKRAFKNERKTLRNTCKENSYFINNENEKVDMMTNVEFLCEGLSLMKLQIFNHNLKEVVADKKAARQIFLDQVTDVKVIIEQQRAGIYKSSSKETVAPPETESAKTKSWLPEDVLLLIKSVNIFPAGTVKRWDVVAEYLNQHSAHCTTRVAKDVLHKAKELQNSDESMKEAANKNAYKELEKKQPVITDDSTASQRLETPQEMLGVNLTAWSPDEQRLLEQALKTYPTSEDNRWEKISECVPNRSKKECMKRYKELVERVKAKKAAKVAAGVAK